MSISTFTSREFNQDVSMIKKATAQGPVFITDRGHPAHVLLLLVARYLIHGNTLNKNSDFAAP